MSAGRPNRILRLLSSASLLLLATGMDPSQSLYRENRAGNAALEREDPEAALEHYTDAQALAPDDPRVLYNLGLALAQGGKPEEADQAWGRSAQFADGALLRDTWYNRGVLALEGEDAERAAKSFVEALLVDPTDQEAQHNLELALRALQQQQQQPQQDQSNDENKNEDQQDQQQQDQQKQPSDDEQKDSKDQQEQDQQEKDQKQQEKDQKQQQDKEQQKPEDSQEDQQQKQSGEQKEQEKDDANEEMVERLLDQLQQNEKQALRRALRQQAGKDRKREKAW